MAIDITSGDAATCGRCGTTYSRWKGYFPVSYAVLHKGLGHIPVCRQCIENMYDAYLAQCDDPKLVVRQLCRKLDLFWSESVYETTAKKASPRSLMTQYMQRLASTTLAGKSYDDTLKQEGTLWTFAPEDMPARKEEPEPEPEEAEDDVEVPDEIREFWGPGYSGATYLALNERYNAFVKTLPDGVDVNDIGTSTIIRQICGLEHDIARSREAGKSSDRSVAALNSLLGSANLKPAQQKEGADADLASTPLGVWLYKYENQRPLPEVEDDVKHSNKILKYVFTWLGHVCKMLGKKNGFSKMYEEELAKWRIDRPDIEDDDDEEFVTDMLSGAGDYDLSDGDEE